MAAPADNVAGGGDGRVVVGRISGLYGVRGWVKVFSHTRPKENIFSYSPWQINAAGSWQAYILKEGRSHGNALIAHLEGITQREQAQGLMGCDIAIDRSQLPALPEGEYYWCDLIGLTVFNLDGRELGSVIEIQETGANDVLVIEGEGRHLVPLVTGEYVREVAPESGRIVVHWDSEWT